MPNGRASQVKSILKRPLNRVISDQIGVIDLEYKIKTMKMTRLLLIILVTSLSYSTSQAQFGKLLDKAKESASSLKKIGSGEDGLDISGGLKEALENGVSEAVTSLSSTDGYLESPYKILVPEDAQKVINTVKKVPGFQDVDKKLIAKMNEAAEVAAKKATPIFVDAITSMSITDAKDILFGNDDAATRYLEKSSREALYGAFMPVIQDALSQVGATKYWNSVVTKYNKLPLTKDVNPNLDDHVNNKALDGMFGLIKVKEDGIRKDVSQRTSPLLKDVFGKLDN